MGHSVLSARSLELLKAWLTLPARNANMVHSHILGWAMDPDHGGLPQASAKAFANWLDNNWEDWTEEPQTTTKEVLEGAVTDWCGGREMPS